MKNDQKFKYLHMMLAGFGAISMSVLFFFLLYKMKSIKELLDWVVDILAPFVYGGIIAYLLRPLCNHIEEFFQITLPGKLKRLSHVLGVVLSVAAGVLIIYALINMIAPQLYESVVSIWEVLPARIEAFIVWAEKSFGEDEELVNFVNSVYMEVYNSLDTWAEESLVPQITNLMGGVGNIVTGVGMSVWKVLLFLKNILIGFIVAVYLLSSRKRFARQGLLMVRGFFKPRWADLILNEIRFVDRMFSGFIEGKILDSAIIGVLCYIGCSIFHFPNALLVSVIVGVTNIIPFFGPFIGAAPATFLILIESPIKALWFVLFVLVLQQLDGNVIGPKILGDRTGLSSFWVLFSIVLFGGLWGLVGMVICVPLFAVIYDLLKKLVYKGLAKHGSLDIWKEYKYDFGDESPKPRSAEPRTKKPEPTDDKAEILTEATETLTEATETVEEEPVAEFEVIEKV